MQKNNTKKDIAFITYYPFHWYVYKDIYKHIKDRSEFIIDLSAFDEKDGINTYEVMVDLLKKNNVQFRVLKKEDYFFSSYLKDFFSEYKVLVSVWERGCMILPETQHLLKVNTTYGAGKELTMVRPSRAIYDLILSYGPRDAKLYSLSTTTIPIGNPKFDDFYNKNFDRDLIKKVELDKNKKTVLYLPTHSDLSSFKIVMPKLIELSSEYNILVKLHYYIEREESKFIDSLDLSKVKILKDDADLITLLNLCDLAISDNSSAIFDVIQANKPLLVADFWDENYLDITHKNPRFYKRGRGGALTFSDSIEQIIKREGHVPTFREEDDLKKKIEESLSLDGTYSQFRKKIIKELFAYEDGRCGARGAENVLDLINGKIESRKGIMYHGYETAKATGYGIYRSYDSLVKENDKLKKIVADKINKEINIVIFDTNIELTQLTIRSVVECSESIGIFVISKNKGEYENLNQKVRVLERIDQLTHLRESGELGGCMFVESGIIFNFTDYKNLVFTIENNQDLESLVVIPKKERNQTEIQDLNVDFIQKNIYKNTIFTILYEKNKYFGVRIIYLNNIPFKGVGFDNKNIQSIKDLVIFMNSNFNYLMTGILKGSFRDLGENKEMFSSLYKFGFAFFESEFFIRKCDRYGLISLLKDILLDSFDDKKLILIRFKFYYYLNIFRYSHFLEGIKKSLKD